LAVVDINGEDAWAARRGASRNFYAGSLVEEVSRTTAYADGETTIPPVSKLSPTKELPHGRPLSEIESEKRFAKTGEE